MKEQTLPPILNSIPNSCQRLNIGRSYMYELIRAGEIKTVQFGRRRLIPESELQRIATERLEGQCDE